MITSIDNYNLYNLNTFRINAICDKFIEYTSADDLYTIKDIISQPNIKFHNIGMGSNVLFSGNYPGIILHSNILDCSSKTLIDGTTLVRAGAGIEMDSLIDNVSTNGLWGLENLSGIPGTVGASAVQNIGAYGVEACDVIFEVECFDIEKNIFIKLSNAECRFGYRNSLFKQPEFKNRYIVTYVTYHVTSNGSAKIGYGSLANEFDSAPQSPREVRDTIIRVRNNKLPLVEEYGSAGSFFKNPIVNASKYLAVENAVKIKFGENTIIPSYKLSNGEIKIPAAWLIEKCNLNGKAIGGAEVWQKQPLVIVNKTGKATSQSIIALKDFIISEVNNTFGIQLQPEVDIL